MGAVRRKLYLMFLLLCVLLTSCNSIIYNGNFHVKTYEPETLADSSAIDKKVESVETQDEEKYNIEGTPAFYILPNHENRPDHMIDFKVLDYDKDNGLIYCYRTPYYGSGVAGDVGVDSLSGTAPKDRANTEPKETKIQVTVLMSYQPKTRAYKVFFSSLSSLPQADKAGEGQGSADSVSTMEDQVIAHKMVSSHEYFLFVDNVAYLYDASGQQVWTHDYGSVVSQEINRLAGQYGRPGYDVETTVKDAVMDGYRYVYIPITIQVTPHSSEGTDIGSLDKMDEAAAGSSHQVILSCCNLDIGTQLGDPKSVLFTSANQNWKAQLAMWKEMDGQTVGSKEDFDRYTAACTMDNIKTGKYQGMDGHTDVRDSYPIFSAGSLGGNSLNMQMAYVPDLFQLGNGNLGRWLNSHMDELRTKVDVALPDGLHWWSFSIWYDILGSNLAKNMFWSNSTGWTPRSREQWANLIDAALVLDAESEGEGAVKASLLSPLSPGGWKGSENASPFSSDPLSLESLFAYKTTVYDSGKQVSRYADVRIPGRYLSYGDTGKKPYIKPIAYTDPDTDRGSGTGAPITRTLTYYQMVSHTDEEGNESVTEEDTSVVQTAPPVPMAYALMLPPGTQVYWTESQETDDVIVPSGEFGTIHFKDISDSETADEDALSGIIYEDGMSRELEDRSVPGRAVDAGDYYVGNQETVAFITSTGVKFYQRAGDQFQPEKYIPLENFAQATGYSMSALGIKTYTDQSQAKELSGVTDSQDDIINEKIDKGKASEILSASNFAPLSRNEMLLSSLYSGLILCNIENGLTAQLEKGSYYASFPEEDSGGKQFLVVGYQTDQYNYLPSDISRAKCYEMDLEAESAKQRNQAVETYLNSLEREYLGLTHRVTVASGQPVPVAPTAEEEKEIRLEETLFIQGDETKARNQLASLMGGLNLGVPSEEIYRHLDGIRQTFHTQRAALATLYKLSGVGVVSQPPTDGELLSLEGQMITTNYAAGLESVLVELALTDRAVNALPGDEQQVYQGYQRQKAALNLSGQNMNTMEKLAQGGSSQDRTDGGETAQREIQEASFYQSVLDDLKKRYEAQGYGGAGNQGWDSFIEEKLKQVSPYRSINPREEGLEEFRRLTGLTRAIVPEDEKLLSDLAPVNRVWDLEELIVEYKLNNLPAKYQSTQYRAEFKAYEETSFASRKDQRAAFVSSNFYQIIRDLQKEDGDYLKAHDRTWDEMLKDIILKCGAGVVVPEES